jgi:hypothetical protein
MVGSRYEGGLLLRAVPFREEGCWGSFGVRWSRCGVSLTIVPRFVCLPSGGRGGLRERRRWRVVY